LFTRKQTETRNLLEMQRLPEEVRSPPKEVPHDRREVEYDVAVVGAGPAGAAAALALVRKGLSVAVLSRPSASSYIGETVPPPIVRPLSTLGLWGAFLAARHSEAPGIVVAWGDPRPSENDFVFSAYGPGWHLNRTAFDAMVVAAARNAGAQIDECLVLDCLRRGSGGWRLSVRGADGSSTIDARWIVDASGRSGWLARRIGAVRIAADRLTSLVKFLPIGAVRETRTLIEACETGWWYAAALQCGRAIVAYFTDVDLLPRGAHARTAVWNAQFALTSIIADVYGNVVNADTHCFAAGGGHAVPCAGSRWIAIGDAASSYDPLSGQGIMNALMSAIRGANFIVDGLNDGSTSEQFIETSDLEYRRYLQFRAAHYGREMRWPNATFWRRRQSSPGFGTDLKSRGFIPKPKRELVRLLR
jgi:flavin-dependent dehydrogenase